MHIYDISQPVLSCTVYPGDPMPQAQPLCRMAEGELYNLTAFSMCAHNGTHVDAPFHFIQDGKTIEQIPLETWVGTCFVARCTGELTAKDAEDILCRAAAANAAERILIAGDAVVTLEAAEVFAGSNIRLLGVEGPSVGPVDAPMAVHLCLLRKEIVLLEGLILQQVPEGCYLLNAAPLNLEGFDGAPCRAWLMTV